jgi:soluble lytic murein transglycosylase-like protein
MVSRAVLGVALLFGLAPRAAAAAPDWRKAGGALFVASSATAAAAAPTEPSQRSRLPPLSQPYAAAIADAAGRHGLDPKLLHALVTVESAYRADAVSRAGAAGLTQLMPATAAALDVRDRFDPRANLEGGADYLAGLLLRFGDLRLALAAYNSGPNRVAQLGRAPDLAETRTYVARVIDCYLALSAGRGVRSAGDCRSPGAAP